MWEGREYYPARRHLGKPCVVTGCDGRSRRVQRLRPDILDLDQIRHMPSHLRRRVYDIVQRPLACGWTGLYLVTWEPEYLSGPPPRCPRVLEDEPVVECSAGCHHARARAMRVMGITPNPIPLYDTVLSLLVALSETPTGGWPPL